MTAARILRQKPPGVTTIASEVITCTPSSTTRILLSRMTELRLRHLPVVGDKGQLVGMVSIGDVVKLRPDDLVTDVEALHGYITTG
jgi:CBS domain-containing protein